MNKLPFDALLTNYILELDKTNIVLSNDNISIINFIKKRFLEVVKSFLWNQYVFEKHLINSGIFEVKEVYKCAIERVSNKFNSIDDLPDVLKFKLLNIYKDTYHYLSTIISKFEKDKNEIKGLLNLSKSIEIKKILFLGDPHNGCQSVVRLTIEDDIFLMYKPNEIRLSWFVKESLKNFEQLFLFPKQIIKEEYYWEEYISYSKANNSLVDVSTGLGVLSGFAQMCCFSDLHYENLIIHNNKIVIFDFETIFDFKISTFDKLISVSGEKIKFGETPLISSILPTWFEGVYGGYGNLSFIGGPTYLNYKHKTFDNVESNNMTFGLVQKKSSNIKEIDSSLFINGYTKAIEEIDCFNAYKIKESEFILRRKVYRSTKEYWHIIDMLSSKVDVDLLSILKYKKVPKKIIELELTTISRNIDIPYFVEKIDSKSIEEELVRAKKRAVENIRLNISIIKTALLSQNYSFSKVQDLLLNYEYNL